MEPIRAFAAIGLGEELKSGLLGVQRKLRDTATERHVPWIVRWVAPENIHLTLKFLGEVDASRIPELSAALQVAAEGLTPFTLTVRGLGCFPDPRRPNVIWAGLTGQSADLVEFARRVEEALCAVGFPRDRRPFSPHLTLGRIKREARPPDRAAIGGIVEQSPATDIGFIDARAVHLIRSDLTSQGPNYTTLVTVQFHDPLPRPA